MFPLQFSEIFPFESSEILHHASVKTFLRYIGVTNLHASIRHIYYLIFKVNGNALLTNLKQKDKSKHVPQS